MALDYQLPQVETILAELDRLKSEKEEKIQEIKALYKVETDRLRALLRLALAHGLF